MTNEKEIIIIITVLLTIGIVSSLGILVGGIQASVMGALLVPCIVFSYSFPRWGILVFLIYLPLGGTISYGLVGVFQPFGASVIYTVSYPLFHLAKEAFYLPALLRSLISYKFFLKSQLKFKPLLIVIALFGLSCLLTFCFVNFPQQLTSSPDKVLLMGIIGLKNWLGYIPLIFCAYYLLNNKKNLIWLNRLFIIIIFIACTLCFIQYLLLVYGICPGNSQLPEPSNISASLRAQCFVGGSVLYNPAKNLIRLPGTFVAPWQWAWFLISSSFLTYGIMLSEPSRLWKWISFCSLTTVLIATLISGQRTALLLVPIVYLLLLLLTEQKNKNLAIKLGFISILTIIITTQIGLVDERIANFIGRWEYSPPQRFIAQQIQWLTHDRITWLGHGLGKTASAARHLGSIQLVEVFPVKIVYEIGILGFLGFFSLVTTLTILTFKAYGSLKTPGLRHLGLCLWLFILLISYNPYYYPLTVDPVAVYYWFFAGILLKLPVLEQEKTLIPTQTK